MPAFDRSRGLGDLLRDLAHGGADLLRHEVRLARLELMDVATNVGRGAGLVALGGVLMLLGCLSLAAGVVLLAGDQWLPNDQYWVAALLIMLITGALAYWLMKRGRAQLSPAHLMPGQTVQTLREDKEWLKRQLTSDATSS